MSDIDWSRLAREQDDYVHEQDRKEYERRIRMKEMYKNQLLKMIEKQRDRAEEEKNDDKKLIKWMNQKQKSKSILQDQARSQNKRLKEQMARYNLNSNLDKRNRIMEESEETTKFYSRKNMKAMTEMEQQRKSRERSRQSQKQQLSKAYDSQMLIQQNKKLLEKLEDKKFTQLRQEIQRKKQESRRMYFQKLRNGHKQSSEVYEHSKSLIIQHQKQKTDFIQKLINEDNESRLEIQKRKQEQKLKKLQEASKFNRNYFETRYIRDRLQSMQETAQIHNKYQTLQQELQSERERNMREKIQQKNMLKNQLEKQIDEAHFRESRKYKLNEEEQRMNRSGQHIARLPGISKDYSSEKQQQILYSFLGGRRSTSTGRPF